MGYRSIVILFLSLIVVAAAEEHADSFDGQNVASDGQRVQRQIMSSTPPPKRRPANIFRLFSVLLAETRDDARKAFSDIGKIFNSQFTNTTTRQPPTTEAASSTTVGNNGTGEDASTTTEPYRITRDEFNGIIMSNFRGIFRLFGKELSNAIRDSNKNIRQFGRDLRDQIRPYIARP